MIPVGQWGAHDLLYPYAKKPHLVPRAKITMKVGDPVPLDDLRAQQPRTPEVINQATDADHGGAHRTWSRTSAARQAPAERFDPRKHGPQRDRRLPQAGAEAAAMTRICVLGAGSWGTAFSLVLADAGNDVTLWARREEVCETINQRRENTDYLPGVELPAKVTATHDTERALADAEVVVFAVPSQTFRANLEQWAPYVPSSAVMVSLMKGVELGTLKRMSEVIAEVTDAGPARIAVVSGPEPLPRDRPARAGGVGGGVCRRVRRAAAAAAACTRPAFRPYTSVDVRRLRARRRLQERRGALRSGWPSASASATTRRPR